MFFKNKLCGRRISFSIVVAVFFAEPLEFRFLGNSILLENLTDIRLCLGEQTLFLAVKTIIGCLAEVVDEQVSHWGCVFVGYIVQQVPDAPCDPLLPGFPEIRASGGIGRDTVGIDDA